ncbi:MAG TPA: histidine kinase dimerization/phosphoacceptor domain -containing protein [Sphingobium sp.]
MQRKNERFVERLPLVPERAGLAFGVTTALCLLALGIRTWAETILPSGFPFVSFFPAVILSSFLFGIRPGIYAAILCGLFSWYFFIAPSMTFMLQADTLLAMGFYTVVCTIDIALVHWMQRANYNLGVEREKSRALAENREMLFRELQHRVSNNIQVVAALISLQSRNVSDGAARKALDEAHSRLNLIGKIGRALYDPTGQRLGVRGFMESLTADILEASGRRDLTVSLDIDEAVSVHPDMAVPLSLIVAETISNAIEHGFPGSGEGSIALALQKSDAGRLILEVTDDGKGLPADFHPERGGNLGLRIATALAGQLGGVFSMAPGANGGARAMLDIPA